MKTMRWTVEAREFVFRPGEAFASCHASTVLALPGGDALCAWFAGSREGAPDVAVWMARRSGGGWEPVRRVAKIGETPHWNPVLFQWRNGRIWLFFKIGTPIPAWRTMVMESADGGRTWDKPRELVPGDRSGGRGPVRSRPVQTPGGTVLAPASVETADRWDAFVDVSADGGAAWRKSPVPLDRAGLAGKGVIQPALWLGDGGAAHMLLRSTEGRVFRSDSPDGGKTWSPAVPTALPNNNSGIDVAYAGGALVLAYNPVAGNWGPRTPLCLAASFDGGQTWGPDFTLEDGEGEFSYPSLHAADGVLHVTYTWWRETIAYRRIRLDAV